MISNKGIKLNTWVIMILLFLFTLSLSAQVLREEFPPPTDLEVVEVGDRYVELGWSAPAAMRGDLDRFNRSLEGYNVYRDGEQIDLEELITVTTYEDTDILNDYTYQYYVTAVYTDGESEPSNIVEATPFTPYFASGSGTEDHPYIIETAEHLYNIRLYLAEDSRDDEDDEEVEVIYWMQANDIDMLPITNPDEVPEWQNDIEYEKGDFVRYFTATPAPPGDHTFMCINPPTSHQVPTNTNFWLRVWRTSQGWLPYGTEAESFQGTYDGNGNTINGLFINRDANIQGLFGYVDGGKVVNLGLPNANITGRFNVGGFFGYSRNSAMIDNCYITGSVAGTLDNVGGLIGFSEINSHITNSYSSSNVSGRSRVGGLVGRNRDNCNIDNSYSTGNVSGTMNYVGGLIGLNERESHISNSYATGIISGERDYIGGLIGQNEIDSNIIDCYSTGDVIGLKEDVDEEILGSNYVGGLIGNNMIDSAIINSYSIGDVVGEWYVGGLIGRNEIDSVVFDCYSNGSIDGGWYVGGLIGWNEANSLISQSFSSSDVVGDEFLGGLVGHNWSSRIDDSNSNGDVSGYSHLGGLVGFNRSYSSIHNCYSTGNVTGGEDFVGGLVGINSNSIISKSYSTGNVSSDGHRIGGLAGVNWYSSTISNCYSIGNVDGNNYVGGLVGFNFDSLVDYSYSIGQVVGAGEFIGGLIGQNWDDPGSRFVGNSYWNVVTSGQTTSDGGEGRTTEEMTYPYADNTYIGWYFSNIWGADVDYTINNGYPHLLFMKTPLPAIAIYPENEANEIPVDLVVLEWELDPNTIYEYPEPEGYLFAFWESDENAPSIVDMEDVGIATTYEVTELEYDKEYNWQVIPYIVLENGERYIVTSKTHTKSVSETRRVLEDNYLLTGGCRIWKFRTEEDLSLDETELPFVTELRGNYPNPFNPETKIVFTLAQASNISIEIFNIRGQRVKSLINDHYDMGFHEIVWDGSNDSGKTVSSGIYFYKMTTHDYNKVNKMMLLK
ncbi:MAG: T9SS type A sorting domain-containing protein [Candidatus Cloacimonetes bacterium]|nr:T9SS type A sorting domain-containing protein [Candidatus Cloacimonadota bacterium]